LMQFSALTWRQSILRSFISCPEAVIQLCDDPSIRQYHIRCGPNACWCFSGCLPAFWCHSWVTTCVALSSCSQPIEGHMGQKLPGSRSHVW
jgi:hypothetical protein